MLSTTEILEISKEHLERLNTLDPTAWEYEGMEFFKLSTVTRSQRVHDVVLPIWRDCNNYVIIVGSFGGSDKEPRWVGNLRKSAGLFYNREEFFCFKPEFLSGIERVSIWEQLCADRPYYLDYQKRTTREFPVIRIKR